MPLAVMGISKSAIQSCHLVARLAHLAEFQALVLSRLILPSKNNDVLKLSNLDLNSPGFGCHIQSYLVSFQRSIAKFGLGLVAKTPPSCEIGLSPCNRRTSWHILFYLIKCWLFISVFCAFENFSRKFFIS